MSRWRPARSRKGARLPLPTTSSFSTGRPRSRRMRSPASSRPAADSSPSWGARPRPRRCSTARLAAISADGRSSTPPRPCCRDLPRPPPSCSRGFLRKFSTTRCGAEAPRAVFSQNCHFPRGRSGSSAPLWLTLDISGRGGHDREGRHGRGWSLRMLRGAQGRAAIARGARIAAFAVSAAIALWAASLAAEPAATEPAAKGPAASETAAKGAASKGTAANGAAANGTGANGNGRLVGAGAGSGTMDEALIQSYQNNPQLNSQRSATRAIDENVPTALAGYRPRVSGTASLTDQYLDQLTRTTGTTAGIPATYTQAKGSFAVQSYGLTATQTLYNGLQTATRTRQAEGQVFSARETLRTTEQNVLLQAATAYMNLLQTAAILELQRSNVNVLEVTLRQTRDRFTAGEVTRTDVAQAESRLSGGRSQLSLAESNYVTAQAQYLQVIGVPPPRLAPAPPVDRLSPRTLDGAIARGRTEHPLITTAMYNVDIALQQVKIAEGALAPTLAAVGNVQKNFGNVQSLAVLETLQAS